MDLGHMDHDDEVTGLTPRSPRSPQSGGEYKDPAAAAAEEAVAKESLLDSIKGLLSKERRLFQLQLHAKEQELEALKRGTGAGGLGAGTSDDFNLLSGGAATQTIGSDALGRIAVALARPGLPVYPAATTTTTTTTTTDPSSPASFLASSPSNDAEQQDGGIRLMSEGGDFTSTKQRGKIQQQFAHLTALQLSRRCAFEKPLNRVCQVVPWLERVVVIDLSHNNLPDLAGEYIGAFVQSGVGAVAVARGRALTEGKKQGAHLLVLTPAPPGPSAPRLPFRVTSLRHHAPSQCFPSLPHFYQPGS